MTICCTHQVRERPDSQQLIPSSAHVWFFGKPVVPERRVGSGPVRQWAVASACFRAVGQVARIFPSFWKNWTRFGPFVQR